MSSSIESNFCGTDAALFPQAIKRATASQHALLESNALLSSIVSSQVTVAQYYCYLVIIQKIMWFYEENILPLLPVEQKKMTRLITDDLQSIGYLPTEKIITTDYHLAPGKISTPFAWGFAYVMEGSKLGGKVIFKHIHHHLGFSENYGASFIADYGADTFGHWKVFLEKFSSYVAEKGCEEEAIQGALYAFKSIYAFFELNRFSYEA